MGHGTIIDLMIHDGLTCSFTGAHMGNYGNQVAEEMAITREQQDEWALRSHRRAVEATKSGKLPEEIVPVQIEQKRAGQSVDKR